MEIMSAERRLSERNALRTAKPVDPKTRKPDPVRVERKPKPQKRGRKRLPEAERVRRRQESRQKSEAKRKGRNRSAFAALYGIDPALRICLGPLHMGKGFVFPSFGKGNRICSACTGLNRKAQMPARDSRKGGGDVCGL